MFMGLIKISLDNSAYIESFGDAIIFNSEREILDLIGSSSEHDTPLFLFHGKNISSDFFNLSTGLAGYFFQKCSNYCLRAAFVINFEDVSSERFKELMSEMNNSSQVRFFNDKSAAEKWLVS